MSPHNRRMQTRHGLTFGCRYVQRTLSQLGEDALSLPLVSRHLLECPACRAHRRRITRVDRALQEALLQETPTFFEGRWDTIRTSLPIGENHNPERDSRVLDRLSGRLITAVLGLAIIIGAAWSIDQRTPADETPIAVAPGVSVTAASVEGEKVSVALEAEDDEDGTLYIWLGPGMDDPAGMEDRE